MKTLPRFESHLPSPLNPFIDQLFHPTIDLPFLPPGVKDFEKRGINNFE
jgi:hypothetical protein